MQIITERTVENRIQAATAAQLYFLQALLVRHGQIPQGKETFALFIPNWSEPPKGLSRSEHAADLLSLVGVGQTEVAATIAYMETAIPVDSAVVWRTLRLRRPSPSARANALLAKLNAKAAAREAAKQGEEPPEPLPVPPPTARVERTVLRRKNEEAKVAAAMAPPVEAFNPIMGLSAWPSRKR